MTREEKAIIYFKDMRKRFCEDYLLGVPKDSIAYKATMTEKEFYDTAIQALEQKAVLDKIIEEIEIKLKEPQYQHVGEDWQVGLIIAEDIIDKYKDKVESEE